MQNSDGSFIFGNLNNLCQGVLGLGGNVYNLVKDVLFYFFVNFNLQVVLYVMEISGNIKMLFVFLMVVLNNQVVYIQVGNCVLINIISILLNIGIISVYSEVQYLDIGVIFNVQLCVNFGGLVYFNIGQQVSQVDCIVDLVNGNLIIVQCELVIQVVVQSGQIVLFGGLIQQDEGNIDIGVFGFNCILLFGWLFGIISCMYNCIELIVLIILWVIVSSDDVCDIINEYQQKFELLVLLCVKVKF